MMKKIIAMFALSGLLLAGVPAFAQHQQEEKHQKAPKQTKEQKHAQRENGHSERGGRLSARGGQRIPEDRFRGNFGRGHYFQVNEGEFRAGRFEFGGFAFGFVDPWPAYWAYSDDVYIDDIDGVYFLLDPRFPGERVEVVVQ